MTAFLFATYTLEFPPASHFQSWLRGLEVAQALAVPPYFFKLLSYSCVSMSLQDGFVETLLPRFCHIKILLWGAREMAQWLQVLTALPET